MFFSDAPRNTKPHLGHKVYAHHRKWQPFDGPLLKGRANHLLVSPVEFYEQRLRDDKSALYKECRGMEELHPRSFYCASDRMQ